MVVDLLKLLESKDFELEGIESEIDLLFNNFMDETTNHFESWFEEQVTYYIETNTEQTFSLGNFKLKSLKKELLLLLKNTPTIVEKSLQDKDKWWHLCEDRYETADLDFKFVQSCLALINDCTHAIDNFPNNAYLHYSNRGWARNELSDYSGAIQDFLKAIQLNPQFAEAYSNLGIVRSQLGQYDEALTQCNKAISLRPNDARVYYSKGLSLSNLGYYSEAMINFSKAVELNPQYARSYYNDLWETDLNQYGNALQSFIDEKFKLVAGNVGLILQKYGYITPVHFEPSRNPWYSVIGSGRIFYTHHIPWSEEMKVLLEKYQLFESKAREVVKKIALLEEECKKLDASRLWSSV